MPSADSKPLMTLAVAAFNQERFIRGAVEGAFAQTYSPLQIILSDDCSKDRTFEIMREMAANYRGPHQVELNQNVTNAGLAVHTNRVFELTKGELLVLNAGDDVSLPHRVESIVAAWESSGRKSFGVHSQVVHMAQDGRVEGQKPPTKLRENCFKCENGPAEARRFMREEKPVILGCTAAWAKALYDRFGPLPKDVVYEDMTLGFRARLLGGMAFVDDPLLLYRLHDANIHHAEIEEHATVEGLRAEERRRKIGLERRLAAARSFVADLGRAKELKVLPDNILSDIAVAVEEFRCANETELNFRDAGWLGRLTNYSEVKRHCRLSTPEAGKLVQQLLPRWCYFAARILKSRLRAAGLLSKVLFL